MDFWVIVLSLNYGQQEINGPVFEMSMEDRDRFLLELVADYRDYFEWDHIAGCVEDDTVVTSSPDGDEDWGWLVHKHGHVVLEMSLDTTTLLVRVTEEQFEEMRSRDG